MSDKTGPIEQMHNADMGVRQASLNRMRRIATLVDPGLLPDKDTSSTDEQLPQLRQHVGAYGLQSFRGKILDVLYPLSEQALHSTLDEDAKYSGASEDDQSAAQALLDRNDRILLDRMMSSAAKSDQNRTGIAGFRASKSNAIDYSVGLGECLQFLDRKFQNHVFRPDFYTCSRDGLGNIAYLTVQRCYDALTLDDEVLVKAQLPMEMLDRNKPSSAREVKMTTLYRWEKDTKVWVAEDEIRGKTVHTEQHKAPRYYITPWRLRPTEQVGRGIFESIYALLSQLDTFNVALADNVAVDSDVKIGIDAASSLRPRDIAGSGTIFEGARVLPNGSIGDIGVVNIDKSRTINELRQEIRLRTQDLYKMLLIEQDLYPQQDRVTREQILRMAAQIESMSGGTFSAYSEYELVQTFAAAFDIAETDGLFKKAPKGSVVEKLIDGYQNVRITTGAAAIVQGRKLGRIIEGVQALTIQLPPGISQRRYNAHVVSLAGMPSDLMLTPEEEQAAKQQAIADATQALAAQTGVETAGAVIQQQLGG